MFAKVALLTGLTVLTVSPVLAQWSGTPSVGQSQGGWTYEGCAVDTGSNSRSINGPGSFNDNNMTVELCLSACKAVNAEYAGLQYGSQCRCGTKDSSPSWNEPSQSVSGCTSKCSGSASQICGGGMKNSVYRNTAYVKPVTTSAAPSTTKPATSTTAAAAQSTVKASKEVYKETFSGYTWHSCFMEPGASEQKGRALQYRQDQLDNSKMTIDLCATTCSGQGFKYAGLEYGGECWCANKMRDGLEDASDPMCAMQCDMECKGNSTQVCGGRLTIDIWENKNWAPKPAKRAMLPVMDLVDRGVAQFDEAEVQRREEQLRENKRQALPPLQIRGQSRGPLRVGIAKTRV